MNRAFTLIELILAMVVMGIAFATLPVILKISGESVRSVSDIRGLYHGAAKVQVVLSKPWDESNVDDFDTAGIYYVLRTNESILGQPLYCDHDKNRSGHYPGQNRRMCESAAASGLGPDIGEATDYDDLDDFNGDHDLDIEGYRVDTSVFYNLYDNGMQINMPTAVAPAGSSANLKHITVSVIDPSGNPLADYHYYAANIGLPKPFVKVNQ